jgi:hypothetical protein
MHLLRRVAALQLYCCIYRVRSMGVGQKIVADARPNPLRKFCENFEKTGISLPQK